jgi:hypothetical protein
VQVNTKVLVEELTPEENFKQTPSLVVSTSKPEFRCENPEVIVPEIKIEIVYYDTPNGLNKRDSYLPIVIKTLLTSPLPELKFSAL